MRAYQPRYALYVDLSTGTIRREPIDAVMVRNYLGGAGLNARLAYENIVPTVDPLSPENAIILGAGPLVGTFALACAKLAGTTKYPITGAIGTGGAGGSFGAWMRWAGYDNLVIAGRAPKTGFLKIVYENVEIRDAADLWGQDIYETTDSLWRRYGPSSVMAIGQAGERQINISLALIDKIGTIGKGGLGAVMGAKNLKAVVVSGRTGVQVADTSRFMREATRLYDSYARSERARKYTHIGPHEGFGIFVRAEYFTCGNFREVYPSEKATRLFGVEAFTRIKKATVACPSCPSGDKTLVRIPDGAYEGLETWAISGFGPAFVPGVACELDGFGETMKVLDLCNRYGLDRHLISSLAGFAVDLYRNGIIGSQDTGGLELVPGFDTTMALIDKVMRREGIGDVLGAGFPEAIRQIGRGCEKYAIHFKGLPPAFDGRQVFGTEAFCNATNPRGALNMAAFTAFPGQSPEAIARHCEHMGIGERAKQRVLDAPGFNVARLTRHVEDYYTVLNSLGVCYRTPIVPLYSTAVCAELFSAATGIEATPGDLMAAAERAWNVQRAINLAAGFGRKDDSFPTRWLEPIKGESGEIHLEDYYRQKRLTPDDLDKLLDDYYQERGWDTVTGIPTTEKLRSLGLDDVATDVEARYG